MGNSPLLLDSMILSEQLWFLPPKSGKILRKISRIPYCKAYLWKYSQALWGGGTNSFQLFFADLDELGHELDVTKEGNFPIFLCDFYWPLPYRVIFLSLQIKWKRKSPLPWIYFRFLAEAILIPFLMTMQYCHLDTAYCDLGGKLTHSKL